MPDVFKLEIIPQSTVLFQSGTLTMSYNGVSVIFPRCKIDRGSLDLTGRGHVMRIKLWDRRWVWRFKHVRGHYNSKYPDGKIIPSTEASPQTLASILLIAMGESRYDVSLLPNFDRPTVDWDYANAADELSSLCEERGCVVSLDIDDIVRIYPKGYATAPLPTAGLRNVSFGINPPEKPDKIIIVGGRALVQSKLKLSAVGIETNGKLRLIDYLSYKPTLGWTQETGNEFPNTLGNHGEAVRELARRAIYKWYVVTSQADGSQTIPGYQGKSSGLWQIMPTRNIKIDTYTDANGFEVPQPVSIEGVYFKNELSANTTANTPVRTPFSYDGRLGLVRFTDVVYKANNDFNVVPADLYITTSYHVQHADTRYYERLDRFRVLGRAGHGEDVIRRPDLVQEITAVYATNNPTNLTGVTTNFVSVNGEADANLAAAAANYQTVLQLKNEYQGILRLSTSGQNRQVTWEIDMDRGFRTWVFANNESEYGVLSYPERRRIEKIRGAIKHQQAPRLHPGLEELPGAGI